MSRLAIIGTAGRNEDGVTLTSAHYDFIYDTCKQLLVDHGFECVISGGSAWADHVAVKLYNEGLIANLVLYLPFTFSSGVYSSDHLNTLHRKFSSKCGINSLDEISKAINRGAVVHYGNGFHDRNTLIAKNASKLIAFTFGVNEPKPGGTFDTWNKTSCPKLHISLL